MSSVPHAEGLPAALHTLDHLEARMARVSDTANRFTNRYYFGGVVTILVLLNTDLLFAGPVAAKILQAQRRPPPLHVFVPLLLVIIWGFSFIYFRAVQAYVTRFEQAYRYTKHKYEVLLYGLMLGASSDVLIRQLEAAPTPAAAPQALPEPVAYPEVAAYLHDRHGRALGPQRGPNVLTMKIPMLLVTLAILIKLGHYLIMLAG